MAGGAFCLRCFSSSRWLRIWLANLSSAGKSTFLQSFPSTSLRHKQLASNRLPTRKRMATRTVVNIWRGGQALAQSCTSVSVERVKPKYPEPQRRVAENLPRYPASHLVLGSPPRRHAKSPVSDSETGLCAFAEKEGFEPPDLLQSAVFKTAAIDHSATSLKKELIKKMSW